MAVDGGVLRERCAEVLQLRFLLIAREREVAALPGGDALLQRRVVESTAQSKHTPKRPLLLKRGLEVVLVGLAYR